jgi:molybdopterin biosynthesis enzyme
LRARLVSTTSAETPAVALIKRQGSGILTSLTDADGLVEVDPHVTVIKPGDTVRFLSFAELGAA